jgi:signal transduction histidine kinase
VRKLNRRARRTITGTCSVEHSVAPSLEHSVAPSLEHSVAPAHNLSQISVPPLGSTFRDDVVSAVVKCHNPGSDSFVVEPSLAGIAHWRPAVPPEAVLQDTIAGRFETHHQVLATLPIPGCILTPNGSILEANGPFLELIEALDGTDDRNARYIADWLPTPDTRERMRRALQRAALGETVIEEYEIGVGAPCIVNFRIAPLRNKPGSVQRLVMSALDVSDRKQPQNGLVDKQKSRVVSHLVTGIVHDFNHVIAVVLANLEMLGCEYGSKRAHALIRNARDAARLGAERSAHLLSIARQRSHEPQATDVGIVVSRVADLSRPIIGERIDIHVHIQPNLDLVDIDQTECACALLNLISNACDAMPDGGHLWIKVSSFSRRQDANAKTAAAQHARVRYVRVVVADTGHGMSEDVRRRALEPFFTTKPAGTGLGLSQVNELVARNGGCCELASAPSRGTEIRLYLPVRPPERERRRSQGAGQGL